jgi:hypothetical protein
MIVEFKATCTATVTETWTMTVPDSITDPTAISEYITDNFGSETDDANFQSQEVDGEQDREVLPGFEILRRW